MPVIYEVYFTTGGFPCQRAKQENAGVVFPPEPEQDACRLAAPIGQY
jgi:hypothetical protein